MTSASRTRRPVRFHLDGERHVGQARDTSESRRHLVVIGFDVVRHVALGELDRFQHDHQLLRLFAHFDNVARLAAVRTDVDAAAVHIDVAVIDELAGGKDRRDELGAINDSVETQLQKTDQVFRGVALAAVCLFIDFAELLFGDVAVMAFQFLLGAQLQTEIGKLALAALTMLARAIFTLVDWGLRAAPVFSPRRRSILYFADLRLLIAFPFKKIHPEPHVPSEGNAPSSGLRFRSLTGFSTHALRKNPRDTSIRRRTLLPGAGV